MSDIVDYFDRELPEKLAGNPGLAKEVNAVYQFDIDGAGQWTLDLTGDVGTVTQGAHASPGCVVSAKAADFATFLSSPAAGMMLFTMGKLKVSNVGLALSLQKILS